jgi:hypothetical protein
MMPDRENFPAIFARLKAIVEPLASGRLVQADTPDNYVVGAHPSAKIPQYPQGIYLAGVHIKKNYVSYYLMPVYAHPELLEGISEPLKKRMQGKSCFNFTKIDEPILDELARLTTISVECFQRDL